MNTIRDDDLVLYHYRDGLDAGRMAEIEAALSASAELRERHAAICRVLAEVDALPVPKPDADLGARVWRNLERRLAASRPTTRMRHTDWRDRMHAWLSPPRLALAAACMLALAIGIGFYAGRRSAPVITASQADTAAARVLDAYVAAHLRATESVLLTASNSDSAELLDGNRELAASLVEANRLYALAAARAGNAQLADFLRQIEPVLISLANAPRSSPVQAPEGLRDYLRSTDLLFQVRATEARLDRAGTHRT